MNQNNIESHPHHYTKDKNTFQKIIDWLVPVGMFLIYFLFYNFGKISAPEMIKTTGLVSIALLSLTLLVGPATRFFPALAILKAHRKFWGVSSFLFLLVHFVLVLVVYFDLNFLKMFDTNNPKSFGLVIGLLSFLILLIVTITSNHRLIKFLHPDMWKKIQTTSYIALILAVVHFFQMESESGVLVIKRSLGQITYWFATIVVIIRFVVFLFPKKS